MPSNLMASLRDMAEMGDVDAQVEFALQFLKGDEIKQNISYALIGLRSIISRFKNS